ncbi:MAG: membrane protein insertion efficiency factor YidD [Planctomycetes bacterium]|nr:membrane protein insertion efficiency factor YidD [Planctomycetota bacterium]
MKSWKLSFIHINLLKLVMLVIRIYQMAISPCLPGWCRYQPTCSQYALEALRRHGLFKGLFLSIRRILRCHPFGGSGHDPVP